MRKALYYFRKARMSMRRTPMLTLSTIGMMMVVFLLFNSFALIAINVDNLAQKWIGQMRLTVFLEPETTPAEVQYLAGLLRQYPEITNALYVTSDEARHRFLADFPGEKSVIDGLSGNPFPASLELELTKDAMKLETLTRLSKIIEQKKHVDEAIFGRELFGKLTALVGVLRLVGMLLGLLLAVAVLFLTANTIRLNLYARKDELEIIQIVGGTRWFIRWPFLIEGFMQGMISSVISICLTYILFKSMIVSVSDALTGPLGNVSLIFIPLMQILMIIGAGAFLGVIGSLIAMERFWRND